MIPHQTKYCRHCGKNAWVLSECSNSGGHEFIWKYRLQNGEIGTEYQAFEECVKYWEHQKQIAEEKIKEFTKKLETAER